MYSILKSLLFYPFDLLSSKFDAFNREFLRWKYQKSFITKSRPYIASSAQLNISSEQARFETDGFSFHSYSQINLNRPESLLVLGKNTMIGSYCSFNIWMGKVIIGANVSFNNYCSINCLESIEIGNDTWFGEGVRFYDHNHKFKELDKLFREQGFTTGKIKIGNNCWIGSNTVILQNVEIGDNCVIGANNLIYKSVPANSIVKAKAMDIVEEIKK